VRNLPEVLIDNFLARIIKMRKITDVQIVGEEKETLLVKKALLGLLKSLKEIHQVLKKAQEDLSLSK
jgi:hypothetical protein